MKPTVEIVAALFASSFALTPAGSVHVVWGHRFFESEFFPIADTPKIEPTTTPTTPTPPTTSPAVRCPDPTLLSPESADVGVAGCAGVAAGSGCTGATLTTGSVSS